MKPTARARIEKAVLRSFAADKFYSGDVVKLILAERARLKRGVRKLYTQEQKGRGPAGWIRGDYVEACDDILALWEG